MAAGRPASASPHPRPPAARTVLPAARTVLAPSAPAPRSSPLPAPSLVDASPSKGRASAAVPTAAVSPSRAPSPLPAPHPSTLQPATLTTVVPRQAVAGRSKGCISATSPPTAPPSSAPSDQAVPCQLLSPSPPAPSSGCFVRSRLRLRLRGELASAPTLGHLGLGPADSSKASLRSPSASESPCASDGQAPGARWPPSKPLKAPETSTTQATPSPLSPKDALSLEQAAPTHSRSASSGSTSSPPSQQAPLFLPTPSSGRCRGTMPRPRTAPSASTPPSPIDAS